MDVLRPLWTASIEGRAYDIQIIDDLSTFAAIYFLSTIGQVFGAVWELMNRAKKKKIYRLRSIRLDSAGEHKGDIVRILQQIDGSS